MLIMSIYFIRSKEPSLHDIYIGSCIDIRSRSKVHKYRCNKEDNKYYNLKLYQFIRANGGWDNFVIEQLCKCDVERLSQVEQEYIDKLNPSLNSKRSYNTEEYTKKFNKEWNKEYYEKNKDKLIEKQSEYYYKNKDRIKEYNKEYRMKNKDKIRERRKQKFKCECGSILRKSDKAQHFKSIKHKTFMENN